MGRAIAEFRTMVTLFAGFAIGIHIAVFAHEMGHALGYWVSGGSVSAIVMEAPAPTGYVIGSTADPRPVVWGGVVFGSLVTLIPLGLSRALARKSLARFAALMVAAFCLAHNGLYLFVGGLLPFGDAVGMIDRGAPPWLLVLLGLPLLAGFVMVLASALQGVDLDPAEPAWKWIVTVEAGLFPVPALTLMPLLSPAASRQMQSSMLLYAATYATCFALAAWRARSAARARNSDDEHFLMPRSWRVPVTLFAAAVMLIAIEWLSFRR
jgi:hypothetical protein